MKFFCQYLAQVNTWQICTECYSGMKKSFNCKLNVVQVHVSQSQM